ncbi:MAG: hypothetical protein AAB461_00595 [Patescibacteria group bacterium]
MLPVFRQHSKPGREVHYKLGVGVMMSYKTLNNLPTKWSAAFPAKELVADIFVSNGLSTDYWLFNTLHYADYEGIDVLNNLLKATQFGGKNMNALQLDMIWPKPEVLRAYREKHTNIQVIIQANSVALEQINNDPDKLAERLLSYGKAIDYVLLDKSMGRGLGMDAGALEEFVKVVNPRTGLEVVVAGGLGPETLHLLGPLSHYVVSIDAQGRLRPSGNALDPIDWNMAAEYLRKTLSILT